MDRNEHVMKETIFIIFYSKIIHTKYNQYRFWGRRNITSNIQTFSDIMEIIFPQIFHWPLYLLSALLRFTAGDNPLLSSNLSYKLFSFFSDF
jgi:hypothetical protein